MIFKIKALTCICSHLSDLLGWVSFGLICWKGQASWDKLCSVFLIWHLAITLLSWPDQLFPTISPSEIAKRAKRAVPSVSLQPTNSLMPATSNGGKSLSRMRIPLGASETCRELSKAEMKFSKLALSIGDPKGLQCKPNHKEIKPHHGMRLTCLLSFSCPPFPRRCGTSVSGGLLRQHTSYISSHLQRGKETCGKSPRTADFHLLPTGRGRKMYPGTSSQKYVLPAQAALLQQCCTGFCT